MRVETASDRESRRRFCGKCGLRARSTKTIFALLLYINPLLSPRTHKPHCPQLGARTFVGVQDWNQAGERTECPLWA